MKKLFLLFMFILGIFSYAVNLITLIVKGSKTFTWGDVLGTVGIAAICTIGVYFINKKKLDKLGRD